MVSLIKEARRVSARTVNAIMTATYWEIARRIVESEQEEIRNGVSEIAETVCRIDCSGHLRMVFSP
ncbi:MAG: hypothetical protein JRJ86_14350 [Deltaproteobacteria bacterium]|nr:hypothetical protein [Deltaproteobacteria bacterium]MBW2345124.1 hypothetical protein [Deltaproteobacteria bacterium]